MKDTDIRRILLWRPAAGRKNYVFCFIPDLKLTETFFNEFRYCYLKLILINFNLKLPLILLTHLTINNWQ